MSSAELAGGFAVPGTGGLAAQVESHYARRVLGLPEPTQRLMLLAATDAIGDAATIWRAASQLGIGTDAATAAASERLLEIGGQRAVPPPAGAIGRVQLCVCGGTAGGPQGPG